MHDDSSIAIDTSSMRGKLCLFAAEVNVSMYFVQAWKTDGFCARAVSQSTEMSCSTFSIGGDQPLEESTPQLNQL